MNTNNQSVKKEIPDRITKTKELVEVTHHTCSDGATFDDENDAIEHELYLDRKEKETRHINGLIEKVKYKKLEEILLIGLTPTKSASITVPNSETNLSFLFNGNYLPTDASYTLRKGREEGKYKEGDTIVFIWDGKYNRILSMVEYADLLMGVVRSLTKNVDSFGKGHED